MDHRKSELVKKCCDKFAIDAYKNVAIGEKHNFVFSPLGAQLGLAILAHGADGNTKSQMQKGLRLLDNDDVVLQGFQNVINDLNSLEKINVAVEARNFISHRLDVKREYLEAVKKNFSVACSTLDFSNPTESARIMNTWVAEATRDNIKEIISEDELTDMSVMLLVNTIYFKAQWKHTFNIASTKWETFHKNEKETTQVSYMNKENDYYHGEFEDLDVQFLELQYKDERCKMIVLLPNKITGLSKLERNLDKISYKRFITERKKKKVNVFLTKFCFETTINLEESLRKMGMVDMFSHKANFSKITNSDIQVVKVLQKSFIAIDEVGTEAASVTASELRCEGEFRNHSIIFRTDRPFMVIIMCKSLPLFYAKFMGDECQYKWSFH